MDTLTLATEAAALWTGVTDERCRYDDDADGMNVRWTRNPDLRAGGWAVELDLHATRFIIPNRCTPGTVWTVEP